ncbi:hypothetical protein MWU59_01670 [Flavobacteriaceae bacterium F08102]|nr:hypothetical protein [Flavobacteriaceae bacterium F08102]
MTKLSKYIEKAWIIIAIILVIDGILQLTKATESNDKAYMMFAFAALACFMYFFKRNFRRRFEARKNDSLKK